MIRHFLLVTSVFLSTLFLSIVSAYAGSNQVLTYQGVLTDSSDTPYTTTQTVSFSIYSPSPSNCLLYSETQSIIPDSKGRFSAQVGSGTRTDSTGYTFNKIFVNNGVLSGLTCDSGTSYAPGSTDDRSLVIAVNGTVLSPSVAIKAVAYALQAQEIAGFGINDIVKIHPTVGSATTFTSAEMARAKALAGASCSFGEILKWNGGNWACSTDATGGSTPGDAGYTGSKGLVAFDTDAATSGVTVASGIARLSNTGVGAATYGTAVKVPSLAINAQGRVTFANEIAIALPSSQISQSGATSGQVLKWNGSLWLPSADATGGSPSDASYLTKGIFQADTDAPTSGLVFSSSGVLKVNSGTGANQIVKLDGSSKLPAVDGSQLTNLAISSSQITAGTLPISRGGTGAVTKPAAFDSLSPNSSKGDITVHNGSTNVVLPIGSNGQVLTADSVQASGVKWASVASGTVTNVTAGTGLTGGTITSTGTLNVNIGTGANQIVQMTSGSKLPAVDGSLLTSLSAQQISAGTLPINRGGTGTGSLAANRLVATDGSGSALQIVTPCSPNYVLAYDMSGNFGCQPVSALFTTAFVDGGNTFSSTPIFGTNSSHDLRIETNGAVRMVIGADGNVGVGTGSTSPSNRFEIRTNSTDTSAPLILRNMASNGYTSVDFYDNLGTDRGGIGFGNPSAPILAGQFYLGTTAAYPVVLRTNDLERIRILSDGKVGIGTSAPSTALDVNGTITTKSTLESFSDSSPSTTFTIPDTSVNIRRFNLSTNTTVTLPAFTGAALRVYSLTIFLKQDATGNRTVTFNPASGDSIRWDGAGTPPTISTSGNKVTIIQFTKASDETVWYGSMVWKEN